MNIKNHQHKATQIAELISDELIIKKAEDGLDVLGNLYYQGFDKIIIHQQNITPDFFDLKNGMAGEILQKFSNYRVRLAIVGDFSAYTSKSIKDFIWESNKIGHIYFLTYLSTALDKLSGH
ncbi:DUF4180 domain-containing protein [Pedobacter sp. ASV28]|uniref:DUF4180 domain-containing protein n=1 Tax=Pedobacter sp. ASV28 TaxID=2795123 RepID=UPI0018EE25D9|nr:DUF4180 domain-containing protein [Pedobacter sp. ASV28]